MARPMRRWARLAILPLLAACANADPADSTASRTDLPAAHPADLREMVGLYEGRDYFSLRERLGELREPSPDEAPAIRVLRAAALHAFNEPGRSNAVLESVLAEAAVSDSLRWEARRIRYRNLLRLGRYAEAGRLLSELLASPPPFADSARIRDFRNMRRFTTALGDTPPQRVAARADATLPLVGRGHVEVTVGDSARDYPMDTGANLSTLIRSEAEGLGLEIRPAGLDVGTATDTRLTADVAVADRLEMGGIELRNVVFLVVPDEALTFPGLTIRGILGFPVAEALGELRFRRDGTIEVPARVPVRELRNLALHELTPLVRVGHRDEALLCRFDTGANRTVFYEPFLRRHRARIEAEGTPDTARVGGAGGVRELPGYRIEDVSLRLGGATVTLPEVHVHSRILVRAEEENYLDCNVGQDALAGFQEHVLNFRSMSLLLR